MELNSRALIEAMKFVPKMYFLETDEELKLLIGGIYSAIMWGNKIDAENELILERNKLVK